MMVQSLRSFSINEKICLKYSLLANIHVLIVRVGLVKPYCKVSSLYYNMFACIKQRVNF